MDEHLAKTDAAGARAEAHVEMRLKRERRERESLRGRIEKTTPTCATDRQCELMWSEARQWMLSAPGYKLQHVTDDFMETYNPINDDGEFAARVSKMPQPDGSYVIEVATFCRRDALHAICRNKADKAELEFNLRLLRVGEQVN